MANLATPRFLLASTSYFAEPPLVSPPGVTLRASVIPASTPSCCLLATSRLKKLFLRCYRCTFPRWPLSFAVGCFSRRNGIKSARKKKVTGIWMSRRRGLCSSSPFLFSRQDVIRAVTFLYLEEEKANAADFLRPETHATWAGNTNAIKGGRKHAAVQRAQIQN